MNGIDLGHSLSCTPSIRWIAAGEPSQSTCTTSSVPSSPAVPWAMAFHRCRDRLQSGPLSSDTPSTAPRVSPEQRTGGTAKEAVPPKRDAREFFAGPGGQFGHRKGPVGTVIMRTGWLYTQPLHRCRHPLQCPGPYSHATRRYAVSAHPEARLRPPRGHPPSPA